MRVRTTAGTGPHRLLRRGSVFIGIVAVGLAVGACSGPSGTAKTSAPDAASSVGAAHSAAPSGHSAAPTGASGPAANSGAVPACQTAQLKIAMGPTGAQAGMSGGDLDFTNTSSSACQLVGWPQLVGVTASGTTATAVQVHSTQFGPFNGTTVSAVRLSAGATAAVVFIVSANNCADTYQTLQVTPPGNTQSVTVSAWLPQIKTYLPACTSIDVSPLVVASTLPNPAPEA
jgi:hypothetical protein